MTATWIRSHISPFLFVLNLEHIFITSEYDSHIFWIDTVCFDTTYRAVRVRLKLFYFISIVIKTLGSALNMEVGS